MPTFFSRRKSDIQTGIVSDENGTAVASILNPGKAEPSLQSCQFEVNSTEEEDVVSLVLKGTNLGKHRCSTLLNIGEYQLLVVDAPEVPPQELRAAVRWKIQDLIDYHIDDAIVDVFDAPPGGPAGTRKQMYVVVAKNATVRHRIDRLESMGVNLSTVDIPELAMRNIAARLPEDQFGLVSLYFSQQQCLITLTHNATLFLTRTVDFRYSDLNEKSRSPIEFSDRLALEIQRSLDYYEQHFHKAAIQTIAMLPTSVSLEGLAAALQQKLGLTIRSITVNDILGSDLQLELQSAATCMLAIGSALRNETRAL
jgi:MSHA biogenesis protein MshI